MPIVKRLTRAQKVQQNIDFGNTASSKALRKEAAISIVNGISISYNLKATGLDSILHISMVKDPIEQLQAIQKYILFSESDFPLEFRARFIKLKYDLGFTATNGTEMAEDGAVGILLDRLQSEIQRAYSRKNVYFILKKQEIKAEFDDTTKQFYHKIKQVFDLFILDIYTDYFHSSNKEVESLKHAVSLIKPIREKLAPKALEAVGKLAHKDVFEPCISGPYGDDLP